MNLYLYIKLAYVYHLVVFSHRDPFLSSYLNIRLYVCMYVCMNECVYVATAALEQQDRRVLLLL